MEFFDKLGASLVTAGRDVSQKAKDLSETAKLKLDLKSKEDFLQKQYAELGRLYYEEHKNDDSCSYEQFSEIAETLSSIDHLKHLLMDLKGSKICPKCGAQMPEDAGFCSNCGENLSMFEEES